MGNRGPQTGGGGELCVCGEGGVGGPKPPKRSMQRSRTRRKANLTLCPHRRAGLRVPVAVEGRFAPPPAPHTHRHAHPPIAHFRPPNKRRGVARCPPGSEGRGSGPGPAPFALTGAQARGGRARPRPGAAQRRPPARYGSARLAMGRAGQGRAWRSLLPPPGGAALRGGDGRGGEEGGGRGAETGAHARPAPSCVPANREASQRPWPMGRGRRCAGPESGWGAEGAGLESRGRGLLLGAWSKVGGQKRGWSKQGAWLGVGGAWGGAYRLVGGAGCGGAAWPPP